MARLRLRLIRFGDRDGLGTSEATRTRGGLPSVAAGARTDKTWQSREIVGFRNWVLGAEWGIGSAVHNGSTGWENCCKPQRPQWTLYT